MDKKKVLTAGIAAGMVMSMGIQAFAASTIEKIDAYLNHKMTFEFDGVQKALPAGYDVVVYQGHSYVPARFLAENLGAKVDWNDSTKVISIQSDKNEASTSPAATGTSSAVASPSETTENNKELPQTKESEDVRLTLNSYFKDDDGNRKLSLSIKNKGKNVITYDQMSATFTVDGTTYKTEGTDAIHMDGRLYRSLKADEETDGYIPIPGKIKQKPGTMHVELTVDVTKDYKTLPQKFSFDVKL